ncbi:MAG: DUF4114 domain-containing protein [Methylococcales bacterium]
MKKAQQYRLQPKMTALAISAALADIRNPLPAMLLGLGLVMSAGTAHATNWIYLNGSTGYDHANGKPNGMTDKSAAMPSNLLQTVIGRLPEGQDIKNNPTAKAQVANDAGANLVLKAPANIKVSYVSEGAGYENSVGFFKFTKDTFSSVNKSTVMTTEKIIFPNFSSNVLQFGKTVDLGNFVANDAIGFTIIGNGWQTVDSKGKVSKKGMVDTNKANTKIFRTIKRFNPETVNASDWPSHTLLFSYPEKQLMVLAFEDLNREKNTNNDFSYTSDNDFNDVIIAIHVDPWSAVDCTNCNVLVPTPTPAPTATPTPAPSATPTPTPPPTATPAPAPTATPAPTAAPTPTPPPVKGESGPISWREITTPTEVTATPAPGGGATVGQ